MEGGALRRRWNKPAYVSNAAPALRGKHKIYHAVGVMAAYNVGQDFQPRLVCLWYDILAYSK